MVVITKEYRENRARFPRAELAKHRGSWVGFSGDGRRILARGATVEQLEQQIAADGGNSPYFVIEYVPGAEEDSTIGAGESM